MDLREYIQTDKKLKRHPWELARLKMLRYFIRRCVFSKGLIADIGSGDAFLAGKVAASYPSSNVVAVDINYEADILKKLKETQPDNLHFANDLAALKGKGQIDAYILMDVLEHVESPEILLKQLLTQNNTHSNTTFIITVPAYQQLFSQHDINLGHYRRYNLKSLNALLQSASLSIIYSGYCYNSLLPLRRWQVWRERKKGTGQTTTNGIHNWTSGSFITAFFTGLLWIEFKISWYLARTGIKVPGLTCYCICKPSRL